MPVTEIMSDDSTTIGVEEPDVRVHREEQADMTMRLDFSDPCTRSESFDPELENFINW